MGDGCLQPAARVAYDAHQCHLRYPRDGHVAHVKLQVLWHLPEGARQREVPTLPLRPRDETHGHGAVIGVRLFHELRVKFDLITQLLHGMASDCV